MHIDINQIFNLLYQYSYLVLFPLVVVEGPIVTIIAGFLTSVGFMGFLPAYITIVAGDLVGDVLFYFAGRTFPSLSFNFSKNKVFMNKLKKNKGKILFFGKLSHAVGGPILFMAGNLKIPILDFVWYNLLATLPKSLILLTVGFYFGLTIIGSKKYFELTLLGLFLISLVMIFIYSITSKYFKKIILYDKK